MSKFDAYENLTPFGLLTDEERKVLQESGPWVVWVPYYNLWSSQIQPQWLVNEVYRKDGGTLPVVNWEFSATM